MHLQGGLTTPNCNEAVLWTNMMSTQTISEAQMEIFRSMTDSDGVTLNDNYRPPLPLNNRTIYTTGVSRLVDLKRFTFFDESIHSQLYSRRTLYVDIPNNPVQTNCLLMFQVMSRHCLVGSLDTVHAPGQPSYFRNP